MHAGDISGVGRERLGMAEQSGLGFAPEKVPLRRESQQNLTVRGGPCRFGALHQDPPDRRLQGFHPLAHRGRCDVQSVGRSVECAPLDHSCERAQPFAGDVHLSQSNAP